MRGRARSYLRLGVGGGSQPGDTCGQDGNRHVCLWGTSDPGKGKSWYKSSTSIIMKAQTLQRRHLHHFKKTLRPREVIQFFPQMISTAKIPISLCDVSAYSCSQPPCLSFSFCQRGCANSFFKALSHYLKDICSKKSTPFPIFNHSPSWGSFSSFFSISLHHEKISHLQYFVAFSTVYNYVHQRYYSISLAILAPFLLPTLHTSASQCFVFNPLLTYFRSNISSTAVSSTNSYSLMNSTYLILSHLPHASQPSVQLW